MKCATVVALLVVSIAIPWLSSCNTEPEVIDEQRDRYLGLRKRALQGSRAKLGLPATSDSTQPWGVVMDFVLPNRVTGDVSASVVALSDGSAAVYVSRGPDPEGLSPQEAIRKAAKRTVNVASELQPQMHKTTTYLLPRDEEEVIFYLLTDSGVYIASAAKEDLKNNRHPLSKLWNAASDLISQFGWI